MLSLQNMCTLPPTYLQAHKKRKESGKQSDVAGPREVTNGQVPQPSGGTEEVDIGIGVCVFLCSLCAVVNCHMCVHVDIHVHMCMHLVKCVSHTMCQWQLQVTSGC